MSSPSTWRPAVRFATVLGITVAAIGLSFVCSFFIEPSYFLPLTAAVAASSWLFGRWGGVEAIVTGVAMAEYLLIAPRYQFSIPDRAGTVGLIIFILTSLLITWLSSSLRASRDLQTSILQGMSDALVVTDRRGGIVYWNPSAQALSGYAAGEGRSRQFHEIFPLREEATGESRSGLIKQVLSGSATVAPGAHTILTAKDGTEYSVEESVSPIRGVDGRVTGAIVVLRNTTKRRQMQDQLTQSQKMEAIARLAGGVAGDFNNLLTVITGFGELLTSEMAPGNPLRRFAEEILTAAERAASLTRQLLAFGKGQSLQVKNHDLNALVANMEKMLGRVVGPTIELTVVGESRTSLIRTDPGQMESIVVNLAMNARDAMPKGGTLVIGTFDLENVPNTPEWRPELEPGNYVMLSISDSGVGMDAETRARLFEPFFTTKTRGQASGLGLSIVYGIVKQHGGHISVFSQPGAGTIFEIYFPRVKGEPARVASRPGRGTETVLIADDEESVRKLVHAVLATRGYTVIEACDGKEALDLFEKNRERVDLVVTDIVMPHMNGYELGRQISKRDPRIKILFMSGYRDSHQGMENDGNRPFLNKPFTPELLLRQVRETLDAF